VNVVLAALAGLLAGVVVGGVLGAQYYVHLGPPWGQYGYEFEGFLETLVGAGVGALVGAAAATALAIRSRRGGRQSSPGHSSRSDT
jgi:gas vesicle protein